MDCSTKEPPGACTALPAAPRLPSCPPWVCASRIVCHVCVCVCVHSYMNSMLQALYLLPKFREAVYALPCEGSERGSKICFALQRVFHTLQTASKGVSTKQLTSSFGWGSIDAFMQHDVQEFCRVLLDSLDTTAKKVHTHDMSAYAHTPVCALHSCSRVCVACVCALDPAGRHHCVAVRGQDAGVHQVHQRRLHFAAR